MKEKDYLKHNQQTWDNKVDVHVNSDFYQMDKFMAGASSLTPIEIPLLGDVSNQSLIHLQCHFGQDTLSLARMGAQVTGVDFSPKGIEKAKSLSQQLNVDADFVLSDVYSSPEIIKKQFDIVFTSYGTITWLPDIQKWADVVASFLAPGGSFVFADFHPAMWMFDDDFNEVAFRYMNDAAIIESYEGTYADKSSKLVSNTVSWNHGLAEVITALQKSGLTLEHFGEYDWSPYDAVNGMYEFAPGRYRITKFGNKLPLVFSLKMSKS